MKGNVIRLNIMHLNSVHLNSIGEVQSVSLKAGESTEDPVYPPTTYTLAANVSNGKVTATKNGTAISLPYVATEGDVIVLSVTPDEGYEFNGWLDGNKSNPRTVTMTGNVVLSASCVEIAKPTYTLSASVTNGKVSAKRNGSAVNLPYTANEGDTIVVSVTPNDGYTFEGWNDGNTDNPRTITMTADVALSAQCVEVVQPPVGNYIQFEDKAVEAICVANWSSDGIGLTEEDAAAVTSIGTTFQGNTEITSFDEFRYFTGVTSLTTSAFEGCSALRSLDATNIKDIGNYALCNLPLQSLNLRYDAISTIGTDGLRGLSCLPSSLSMPSLTSVGRGNALRSTNIEEVLDFGGVTEISAYTFYECTNLKVVNIPSTCTSIQAQALAYCYDLEKVVCRATTPPELHAQTFMSTNSTFIIYVPDASLEAYKTAVNWSAYADRIHPLSEIEGSLVFYDKLVGDGTAYIKTDLMPNSSDNYEWKADPPKYSNKFVFGAKSDNQSALALVYSNEVSYYLYQSHYQTSTKVDETNTALMHRKLRLFQRKSDDKWVRELYDVTSNNNTVLGVGDAFSEYIGTLPLLLFACNKSTTDAAADRIYAGAIYSFIVTDSRTNEVRMSLKPCTWNGEAGMWDEVNGKFYGNAATSGEFSVAND